MNKKTKFLMGVLTSFLFSSCLRFDFEEEKIKPNIDIKESMFFNGEYIVFSNKNNGCLVTPPLCIYKTDDGGYNWTKRINFEGYTLESEHLLINSKIFGVVSKCSQRDIWYPFCYDMESDSISISDNTIKKGHFINFINRNGNVAILCVSNSENVDFHDNQISLEFTNEKNMFPSDNTLIYEGLLCYSMNGGKFVVCKNDRENKEFCVGAESDIYGISIDSDRILISAVSRKYNEIHIYQYKKESESLQLISKIKGSSGYETCSKIMSVGNALVIFVGESYSPDMIFYSSDKGATWKKIGHYRFLKATATCDSTLFQFYDSRTLKKIHFY